MNRVQREGNFKTNQIQILRADIWLLILVPGSQNVADPTDPTPMHQLQQFKAKSFKKSADDFVISHLLRAVFCVASVWSDLVRLLKGTVGVCLDDPPCRDIQCPIHIGIFSLGSYSFLFLSKLFYHSLEVPFI